MCLREEISQLGDKIAKRKGIYNTKKYQELRKKMLKNPSQTPKDRLFEYQAYLRLYNIYWGG